MQPQVVLFEQSVNTGCGQASSAVGPFYCPPDQTIYLDTSFFAQLEQQLGGSDESLAQLYIVGHEWGHHIQNITGGMDGLDLQTTGPDSDGVRLELQADCYAGAWIGDAEQQTDENGVRYFEPFTDQQIADALSAASAVGDDHIQETTSGQVQPETWTHGSSEQRQAWFNDRSHRRPAVVRHLRGASRPALSPPRRARRRHAPRRYSDRLECAADLSSPRSGRVEISAPMSTGHPARNARAGRGAPRTSRTCRAPTGRAGSTPSRGRGRAPECATASSR